MEARIALTRLLDRFEGLELVTTGPLEYRDSTLIHRAGNTARTVPTLMDRRRTCRFGA